MDVLQESSSEGAIRQAFSTDGYVFLEKFIEGPALDRLLADVERFLREGVSSMPREQVYYEDPSDPRTLKQLQHLDEHDPALRAWLHEGPMRRLAELLLDGPVVPKNFQFFDKPPGRGRSTPPHQDGYYFLLEPCEAVTMWLALEAVDEENGCVRYLPGSHRDGMRPHERTSTLGFSQGIVDYGSGDDRERERAFPARTGDLLAHHALTVHRADANRSSNRSRRALGFIYYAERAREDSAAHEDYQRRLAADLARARRI